jgi:hypothetical protein
VEVTAMPVPLLDLMRQYKPLREEIRKAIDRVCDSQRFILGAEVEDFERESAAALETLHAIGVASGTDSLLVALMALGVGQGDQVVMPTFTFFATAGVVARLGATPVFVDVDPVDYCMDPDQLSNSIGDRTRAIIPVHLFGQAAAMDQIMEAAGDVPVVEDCAQAWGADFTSTASRWDRSAPWAHSRSSPRKTWVALATVGWSQRTTPSSTAACANCEFTVSRGPTNTRWWAETSGSMRSRPQSSGSSFLMSAAG